MPSRRTRKRQRRSAEATAHSLRKTSGGWGAGLPTARSDLLLVRRAIKEGWPITEHAWRAIVGEVDSFIRGGDDRIALSAVGVIVAADQASFRAALRSRGVAQAASGATETKPKPAGTVNAPAGRLGDVLGAPPDGGEVGRQRINNQVEGA